MEYFDEYDPTPKLRPIPRVRKTAVFDPCPNVDLPEVYQKLFNITLPEKKPHYFAPIANIEDYIRSAGLTGEKAEEYRAKYTPEPEPTKILVNKMNVPDDPYHVFVNMKIVGEKVRIKLSVPMEPVMEYMKKGKKAPIEVRLKAAKGFGYPDAVLEKMLSHDDYMKKNSERLDTFIENIFGSNTTSKSSKPKTKTVQEALTAKLKKKPVKKY